ncbi:hypothetical protein Syun_003822 [Stephania yunnanensis]|uniref:CRAL-TRIO domain-containing protein n=1 Tax=Stephania yunnanensis TaxID=152371 RepID=A0AAP0L2V4_9MAGN
MNANLSKSASNGREKVFTYVEQQEKIDEVRRLIGPLTGNLAFYCYDASIARYLRARNWNVMKATKMLKETLKWRHEYKPEKICWEEVAHEAETGKIYRSNFKDKHGRPVLVMRPSCQNTKSTKGQIRYLVYCMENAILNLPMDHEQMVWLIDFKGFNMSHISVKVTKETANVLQNRYPERLGVAILYNPPKFFESFWTVVKPFLEPKTYRKVKFVYSDDLNSKKIMEDLFDMDTLESAFGGNNQAGFNINDYAERMREDDKRVPLLWSSERASMVYEPTSAPGTCCDSVNVESGSDDSDKVGNSSSHDITPEKCLSECNSPEGNQSNDRVEGIHTDGGDVKLEKDLGNVTLNPW